MIIGRFGSIIVFISTTTTSHDWSLPLSPSSSLPIRLHQIDRCSFPCRRPHFDPEHYTLARWLTGTGAVLCLVVNTVVLVSPTQNAMQIRIGRGCLSEAALLSQSIVTVHIVCAYLYSFVTIMSGKAEVNIVQLIDRPMESVFLRNHHVICIMSPSSSTFALFALVTAGK